MVARFVCAATAAMADDLKDLGFHYATLGGITIGIDDVIVPAETRTHIVNALEMLADKRQTNPDVKHSNIPL